MIACLSFFVGGPMMSNKFLRTKKTNGYGTERSSASNVNRIQVLSKYCLRYSQKECTQIHIWTESMLCTMTGIGL
jgi:hypothetical protein